jgi:hypothetical protein
MKQSENFEDLNISTRSTSDHMTSSFCFTMTYIIIQTHASLKCSTRIAYQKGNMNTCNCRTHQTFKERNTENAIA